MDEIIQLITKTYGLVGLLILAPVVAVVYQWRHAVEVGKNHIKAMAEKDKEHAKEREVLLTALAKVQESRVNDAKQVSEKVMLLMEEQAGLTKESNIAMDQVRDLLMKLSTAKRL